MYTHFKMGTEKTIYLKPTRIGCSLFNLTHVNVISTGQVKHNLVCYLKIPLIWWNILIGICARMSSSIYPLFKVQIHEQNQAEVDQSD